MKTTCRRANKIHEQILHAYNISIKNRELDWLEMQNYDDSDVVEQEWLYNCNDYGDEEERDEKDYRGFKSKFKPRANLTKRREDTKQMQKDNRNKTISNRRYGSGGRKTRNRKTRRKRKS